METVEASNAIAATSTKLTKLINEDEPDNNEKNSVLGWTFYVDDTFIPATPWATI